MTAALRRASRNGVHDAEADRPRCNLGCDRTAGLRISGFDGRSGSAGAGSAASPSMSRLRWKPQAQKARLQGQAQELAARGLKQMV